MITDTPLLSIIIPCYNDHRFIQQAVKSALAQTWPSKEVIIVDDGSNARTKKVLRELQSKVDQLITQENLGVSAARNNGIEVAKGKFILVLDSDDFFAPEFATKAIGAFQNDPEIKLVTCHARLFNEEGTIQIYKPGGGDIEKFLLQNGAIGNSLFKRTNFLDYGGYDEDLKSGFEDWDLFIGLLSNGGYAYVIPEVLFNYRKREGSRSATAEIRKYELKEFIYKKHSELYKKYFNAFIHEWLKDNKKSESYKWAVINSLDYKVGSIILKPFRLLGFFKK